ncbi:MAG: hypothetical protein ACREBH_01160 [Candidatus Micrarchaeaceae archaeon]
MSVLANKQVELKKEREQGRYTAIFSRYGHRRFFEINVQINIPSGSREEPYHYKFSTAEIRKDSTKVEKDEYPGVVSLYSRRSLDKEMVDNIKIYVETYPINGQDLDKERLWSLLRANTSRLYRATRSAIGGKVKELKRRE